VLFAVAAVVIVAVAVVLATKGSSSSNNARTSSSGGSGSTQTQTTASHHKHTTTTQTKQAKATPPAETSVVVLNGTLTTGLAHRISAELQQTGYSQASALSGRPPGANEVTVVEYAPGHQADANGVARSMSVSHVQPIEQAVATLAGPAKVVVVVGADRAAQGTAAP
jgi:hypothetical protein